MFDKLAGLDARYQQLGEQMAFAVESQMDMWCGTAFELMTRDAPADATPEKLASAKVYADGGQLLLVPHHLLKGNPLRGFGVDQKLAGIFARNKSFGHQGEHVGRSD